MIIVCQTLFKNTKFSGITLFPFILLKHKGLKNDKIFLNHEKIHLRQQLELGIIFFYLWYVVEFAYWYAQYGKWYLAYRKISFEREAYAQESRLDYLKHRKFWSFWKYLS